VLRHTGDLAVLPDSGAIEYNTVRMRQGNLSKENIMMQALSVTQASKIGPLFQRLMQSQPMCTAVLEGIYPGRVYVDNLTQPRTALLTTYIESEAHGIWCFLTGEPANDAFNQSLNAAIFSRQIMANNTPALFFTCDPDDWGSQMDAVMAPRPPIWIPRYHFISRQVGFDWQAVLPSGFTVERMNEDLHQIPGLQLPEDVTATLSKWQAITHPQFMDFGFVILDRTGPQLIIASWATVDFIAAGAGDLGLFTQPGYRRRSLGTIAASAALEYGFVNGLRQVNWTCDADNPGSVLTAEKLGLERIEDYHAAMLIMDEKSHMAFFHQD
jgi:RimJ/RimL family protein N-acetyltransferase